MRHNKVLYVIIGLIIVVVIIIASNKPKTSSNKTANTNTTKEICTDEVTICADGSTVTRTAPGCTFAACSIADANVTSTEGWKEFTDAQKTYTVKYPPTWTAKENKGVTTLSLVGTESLIVETVIDDALLFESADHFVITVGGIPATQADVITQTETTRMVWIPRGGTYTRFSWKKLDNLPDRQAGDAPYYQMIATWQAK